MVESWARPLRFFVVAQFGLSFFLSTVRSFVQGGVIVWSESGLMVFAPQVLKKRVLSARTGCAGSAVVLPSLESGPSLLREFVTGIMWHDGVSNVP